MNPAALLLAPPSDIVKAIPHIGLVIISSTVTTAQMSHDVHYITGFCNSAIDCYTVSVCRILIRLWDMVWDWLSLLEWLAHLNMDWEYLHVLNILDKSQYIVGS